MYQSLVVERARYAGIDAWPGAGIRSAEYWEVPVMSQPTSAPLPEPGKPKLLDQVRNQCRVRHLARKTERAYVG